MGTEGRARIERDLSWEREGKRYLAIYQGPFMKRAAA